MCLSNKPVVYQLCCKKVRSIQDHSVFPMPLPSSSGQQCVRQESEAQLLFSYRRGKQASGARQSACARTALCPPGIAGQGPPPGKEQGKGTWATNTVSSLKASLVPDGSRRRDSNSFSLSAILLPVCEIVCVRTRVFISHGKGLQHH